MPAKRCALFLCGIFMLAGSSFADEFKLQLRYQREIPGDQLRIEQRIRVESWGANETAVIVCDVWDYHHCLNAVRRMDEFVPRMNDFLIEARRRGATIIHAPSDCMPAYTQHPARQRTIAVPKAKNLPQDAEFWCSQIPSEKGQLYPIDQSDGGEDDDPIEHAEWAAKLKALGRNPSLPWKAQSSLIKIDSEKDFISDRGDEVWNVLELRGIKHVILVGVHTNMCVLGRPFGLRQMVRNGKHVTLVRDLTDCMYNPNQWPYVDHFTGNDLIVSHTERFVCPTITSDQILGGQPFRSKTDTRKLMNTLVVASPGEWNQESFLKQWSPVLVPSDWKTATRGILTTFEDVAWFRCTLRIPTAALGDLKSIPFDLPSGMGYSTVWLNGKPVREGNVKDGIAHFEIDRDLIAADDINLLTIRVDLSKGNSGFNVAPTLSLVDQSLTLKGQWQFRLGDHPSWSNIPLPAKFGVGSDILFQP